MNVRYRCNDWCRVYFNNILYFQSRSYTQTSPFLVVSVNAKYRRNDWYWVHFNNIL